jgi:hypothetical protein
MGPNSHMSPSTRQKKLKKNAFWSLQSVQQCRELATQRAAEAVTGLSQQGHRDDKNRATKETS